MYNPKPIIRDLSQLHIARRPVLTILEAVPAISIATIVLLDDSDSGGH
jgi:hypothetical protein